MDKAAAAAPPPIMRDPNALLIPFARIQVKRETFEVDATSTWRFVFEKIKIILQATETTISLSFVKDNANIATAVTKNLSINTPGLVRDDLTLDVSTYKVRVNQRGG